MTETIFEKLVLHLIRSFTYGKIFNFNQVFWGGSKYMFRINILCEWNKHIAPFNWCEEEREQ